MSTTITFSAHHLDKITYLTHGISLAAIETFALQLWQKSNAAIIEVTFTVGKQLAEPEKTGDYATVSLFAKIMLRENATGALYAVILPAPKTTLFEQITNRGWRVKQAEGEDIAAAYSTMSGQAYSFDSGWLCGCE